MANEGCIIWTKPEPYAATWSKPEICVDSGAMSPQIFYVNGKHLNIYIYSKLESSLDFYVNGKKVKINIQGTISNSANSFYANGKKLKITRV